MKVRVPDYYNEFTCLGSKCPDTCCIGWVIEIDEESYRRFCVLEGELGRKVMDNITMSDEGKPMFKLDKNGRCAFLNNKNLCQMHIDLGADFQCSLCDNYPRIGEEFGSLRELGLSVACPEVARMLFAHQDTIKYCEWENDEPAGQTDYCGDLMFEELLELRGVAVLTAQNREIAVNDRLKLYIVMASHMQAAMDNNDYKALRKIKQNFLDEKYIGQLIESFHGSNHNAPIKCDSEFMRQVYSYMTKLDYISPKFVELLETAAGKKENLATKQTELSDSNIENLLVYLIFRYFMKIIHDGDIYSKAAFAYFYVLVLSDMVIKTGEKPETIAYLFSKEIEHCEENMEMLCDMFWEEPWCNPALLFEKSGL